MQIFENTNFDFLGKKWPFIILSLILTAVGLVSLALKGGPRYGIDFRGGALMYVRFDQKPPMQKIRSALDAKKLNVDVQEIVGQNEVIIGTELASNKQLNAARQTMGDVLEATFGPTDGKLDINNTGAQALADRLRDPLQKANVAVSEQQLQDLAKNILNYRDTPPRSGLIAKLDDLSSVPGVTPQIINVLKQETWPSPFHVADTQIVGPKIGADLRHQAILATLYALGGMLVYVAFRFEWIYGVAAVVAVFHDTIITIGLFSIFNKEISLTVIAALLTLVGYSMNDTIVVFDRIRENLKILRRETLTNLINKSVNQTLSRTILTSGLTFLTALSLYLFGGQVLNGFSFCLVIGIVIGTYSSIYIASPILVWSQNIAERRKRPSAVPAKAQREEVRRGAAKVK